jgi:hypothetical protein
MKTPQPDLVRQLEEILQDMLWDAIIDKYKHVILNNNDIKKEALTAILSAIKEALPEKMKHTWHDEIQMNEAELKHYLGIEIGYNAAIAEMEKVLDKFVIHG